MNDYKHISREARERRKRWIDEIVTIGGQFGQDVERVQGELQQEIADGGIKALVDHLRLCGAIPEKYGHDTSEEKLYSKYTDTLLALSFDSMGFDSFVLTERADAADVEVYGRDYSFVADAKVFRLSRTAKNQKDFKIQAMDGWKHGRPYALVVAPLYQLPARTSQIYQQASARNVCILSFSHLAVLLRYAEYVTSEAADSLVWNILRTVEVLNASKDSVAYWTAVNRTLLSGKDSISTLWREEKMATLEAIRAAKEEGLAFLAQERDEIQNLSRDEALRRLMSVRKLAERQRVIERLDDNQLMTVV